MRKFKNVRFPDPLILKYPAGAGATHGVVDWRLEQDFRVFWTDEDGREQSYTARAGLITDRSSIPGWAQSIVQKDGPKVRASIIHDDIYEKKPDGWTRRDADRLLYHGCRAAGTDWLKANEMYYAVRIGGQHTWDT